MRVIRENPNIRKGRFLWADAKEQKTFLFQLKSKIEEGYYDSDKVIGKIVEELAPVFETSIDESA